MITARKWIRKNGNSCHNHGIISKHFFQTFRSIMLFKLKKKPKTFSFFLSFLKEGVVSSPFTRPQNKLVLSLLGHRPQVGRPTLACVAKSHSLCSLHSLRPTSPSRPRPVPVRLRTGEHVAAAESEQQWRRVAEVLRTPSLPRASPAPSPRKARPISL